MTPHGIVTRATLADAEELAANLRDCDRAELVDISGLEPGDTLKRGVLMGSPALTLRTHSGDMIGILTVVPFGATGGIISMSGTPLIEQTKVPFLRGSLDVLRHLDARFETLFNVCDARNEVHVRWLRWMGFSLIRKINHYGANQVPVYEFARIRKCAPL
jgi:hypothetical protein